MKRFAMFLAVVLMICWGTAQAAPPDTFYAANQRAVAWDASPTAGTIQYNVFYQAIAQDGTLLGEPVLAGTTSATEYLVTFSQQGVYIIGVQAQRLDTPAGAGDIKSAIVWSNDPVACQEGRTFGIVYMQVETPSGLFLK